MLAEKIRNRESGIILYGIVPPKKETAPERVEEIAKLQMERISNLPIDGLILYDIQDEASRTSEKRPFPFMETLDCFDYSRNQLKALDMPKIIYRAAGKYSKEALTGFMQEASDTMNMTVFVGASSKEQPVTMSMREAYALLFSEEGTLRDRVELAAGRFAEKPEVMEIVNFIRAESDRAICMPRSERAA